MEETLVSSRGALAGKSFLPLAGVGAVLAGFIGILVEIHVVPYRDLFELNPRRLVFTLQSHPALRTQYILHFAAMALAALAAMPAMYALNRALQPRVGRWLPLIAFWLTTIGLAVFAYASVLNATLFPRLALALSQDSIATGEMREIATRINDHTVRVVGVGGMGFLVGVGMFSYSVLRTGLIPRWIGGLGIVAILLLGVFGALIYANQMPFIWGVTFPPPPEYLLSVWFILVGVEMLRGRIKAAFP